MILRVNSDIIDEVVNSKNELAIEVLRQLAFAIRNEKHAVVISKVDSIRLRNCKDIFSKYELSAFDKVGNIFVQMGAVESKLLIKCVVTFSHITEKNESTIYINPKQLSMFEFYEETHLLTENIEDSDLFKYIVDYYQRKEKISNIMASFYKMMGGGSTTGDVMKYEVELKQHFVLGVADSDYHFLGDTKLGDTAKSLIEAVKNNPFNCSSYHMKDVCEAENLIPWAVISSNSKQKHHELVDTKDFFDMSYFDMKDGVHIQYLYSSTSYDYWNNLLAAHVKPVVFYNINVERSRKTIEEFKAFYEHQTIITGFGPHILRESIKLLPKILPVVKETDLSESQRIEWYNIGKVIMSWCCCYKKMVG